MAYLCKPIGIHDEIQPIVPTDGKLSACDDRLCAAENEIIVIDFYVV
jgi:hypothetical protein